MCLKKHIYVVESKSKFLLVMRFLLSKLEKYAKIIYYFNGLLYYFNALLAIARTYQFFDLNFRVTCDMSGWPRFQTLVNTG